MDVRAEDDLVWTGVVIEGIRRAITEVRALVVAGEDGSGSKAGGGGHFGLHKEEVHCLALIQALNVPEWKAFCVEMFVSSSFSSDFNACLL